ncbi:MAG: 5'/3'-nucleotidase SurE, partial [Planctomycetales bacterium]|nr:5'/3'-nucleotidase SurE [Planctomycetales bacterium]
MRILISNDDGIDAPGLAALHAAVEGLGEVFVVAPLEAHSGCGHRVTTDRGLRIERRGEREFAVDGTPADCVRIALAHLRLEVDWVFAGLNEGGNLGVDVYHSGTVAAAREAAILGKPACALSHYKARGRAIDWELASERGRQAIERVVQSPHSGFWNVNLPHVDRASQPEFVDCEVDPSPLEMAFRSAPEGTVHYAGSYPDRPRIPDADVERCFAGH